MLKTAELLREQGGSFAEAADLLQDYVAQVDASPEARFDRSFVRPFTELLRNAAATQSQTDEAQGTPSSVNIQDDSQFHVLDADDIATQQAITASLHQEMVESGRIIDIPDDPQVAAHYPDLRSMKKSERNTILRESILKLKGMLRSFLNGMRNTPYQFSVDGNILEARLYANGIREVTDSITRNKANMLLQSQQIFENAEYLYSLPDADGNPDVYRWNYFYSPVNINGDILGVRIAIRDVVPDNQSQIYNWGIKKAASLNVGTPGQSAPHTPVSSETARDSIAQVGPNVNGGERIYPEGV